MRGYFYGSDGMARAITSYGGQIHSRSRKPHKLRMRNTPPAAGFESFSKYTYHTYDMTKQSYSMHNIGNH